MYCGNSKILGECSKVHWLCLGLHHLPEVGKRLERCCKLQLISNLDICYTRWIEVLIILDILISKQQVT